MKRICFITSAHPMYTLGGSEVQTYFYAKEFAKQGWIVYFLSYKKKNKLGKFDNKNIKLVFYKRSKFFLMKWLKTLWLIKRINADIYYYRHSDSQLGLLAIMSKFYKKKYVWSTTNDDRCGKDTIVNGLLNKYKKQYKYFFIISSIKLKLESFLFNFGVENSNLIVAQNENQKKIICNDFGKKNTIIVYNSHPIPSDIHTKLQNKAIFVANMREIKQPEYFCYIAEKLQNENYQFLVVGENYSNTDKARKLESLFDKYKIMYLGKQPLEKANQLIGESKILVNTSKAEGFPNTFIQAWMRGVPVVSLNVDPDNLILKNKLGFVCNGDLDIAAKRIEKLLNDNSLWQKYSKNCSVFAKENFNIEINVKKLSKIFKGYNF